MSQSQRRMKQGEINPIEGRQPDKISRRFRIQDLQFQGETHRKNIEL